MVLELVIASAVAPNEETVPLILVIPATNVFVPVAPSERLL